LTYFQVLAELESDLPESIVIARIGGRWVVSTEGILLTHQRELSDAIRHAVTSADLSARRGIPAEVVVENDLDRYTVWNSAQDGLIA
jgi:hypothetical protein